MICVGFSKIYIVANAREKEETFYDKKDQN